MELCEYCKTPPFEHPNEPIEGGLKIACACGRLIRDNPRRYRNRTPDPTAPIETTPAQQAVKRDFDGETPPTLARYGMLMTLLWGLTIMIGWATCARVMRQRDEATAIAKKQAVEIEQLENDLRGAAAEIEAVRRGVSVEEF